MHYGISKILNSLSKHNSQYSIPKRITASANDSLNYLLRYGGDQQVNFVFHLDKRIDEITMKKAMRLCLDVEPILECNFKTKARKPYWERREDLDHKDFFQLLEAHDNEEQMKNFLVKQINPSTDPIIQVRVFRGTNDALVIKSDHSVMDGGGFYDFLTLFTSLYNKFEGNIYFSENQQAAIYKITTPFARGAISGQVTHPTTSLPVENVKIKFWHNSLDYVGGTITTNSTGHYSFECSPGEYDLEILSGYSGGCYNHNIAVEEEQTTIVDVNSNNPSTITMPAYPVEEEEPEGWFHLSPQVIQGLIILGSAAIGIFICCFLTVRITKSRKKRRKDNISDEIVDAQFINRDT